MYPFDEKCPIFAAHSRLKEAHKFWHDALNDYQDPERFRISLNALIQAIRNSTFVLQAQKDKLKDFNGWYEKWKNKMRNDSALKWLNEARVVVVHESDLETKSRARVSIMTWDKVPLVEFNVPALIKTKHLGLYIAKNMPPNAPKIPVEADAIIQVERKWVVNELGYDKEVLTELAYCYGFILKLIIDAHIHFNLKEKAECRDNLDKHTFNNSLLSCMIANHIDRSAYIRFNDFKIITPKEAFFDMGNSIIEAERRYGQPSRRIDLSDLFKNIDLYCERGRQILIKDKGHVFMAHIWHIGKSIEPVLLETDERADLYMAMEQLAGIVEKRNADGIVIINEIWYSTQEKEEKKQIRPSLDPNRKEALQIIFATLGRQAIYIIPFSRDINGEIIADEWQDLQVNWYAPIESIVKVWRKKSHE